MVFDYNKQETFTKQLDIVDIGNTAIRCITEDKFEYYIIIKTNFGKTSILKFGPILPDLIEPVDNYSISFKKIDYKEPSIFKDINYFINDIKKKIVLSEEILSEEALINIIDFKQYFSME